MKKSYKVLALLTAATLLFSCNKENAVEDEVNAPAEETTTPGGTVENGILMSFGASFENDVNTKAAFGEINASTASLSFQNDDRVLVRSGSVTKEYKYDGSMFIPVDGGIAIAEDIEVYYPYGEFELSGDDIVFTMPAAVTSLADLGAKNPLAGKIVDDGGYKVTMKAVGSILKVDVTGDRTLNSLMLSNIGPDLGEEATFTIGWDGEDKPTMATVGNSKQSMTISGLSVTLSETAKEYYFILPAGIAYDDLRVQATLATPDAGGINTFAVERGDWTPTRNQFYKMSFYAGLFSGGAGTSESPYKIANARDFKHISKYCVEGYGSKEAASFLGATYKQTADIDFKNATLTPIGSTSNPFTGVYDGNSKTLGNVSISTTADDTGLFAYLNGATVKDLTVSGSIQSSKSNVGSIAGRANGASILRCVNQATVKSTANSSTNAAVGGIVGQANQTDPVTLESCANEGAVSGAIFLGGIVGDLKGSVDKCVNKANVTGSSSNVGGIAGSLRGESVVRRCYSSKGKEVKGTNRVGGIVGVVNSGDANANTTWVVNCFSNSNITGTANTANYGVGGLVGYLTKGILANGATGDVTVKCSASCSNKNDAKVYVGGIVGYLAADGTIQNVYSPLYAKDIKIGSIHGRSGSGKIGQIVGYTAGTLIGYYFGGCATATIGWQYWGTNSSSTVTAQFAITTANNVSFDWTGPVQKNFEVEEWGVSLSAGSYYMSDLMNVAITQAPLASQYTKAEGEVLTWSPIDGTNTTDTHPIPDALIALGEDYYKN